MSPFYATHAGMLSYVAREFAELARSGDNANAQRLALYASILERMVSELTAAPASSEASRPGA
jgi:hypothetical protein